MADLSGGPAGSLTGWLTMQQGLMPVIDSTARLGQFLQDAHLRRAQMEAQTQGQLGQNQAQQFTNANAPTMMNAQLQGTPFEQQKFQQQAQQQALERQMQQLQFNRQQTLAENTLAHTSRADTRADELARLQMQKPIWDTDSQTWQFPPGGSRMPGAQGQNPPFNSSGPDLSGATGSPDQPIMSHKKAELALQYRNGMITQTKPLNDIESDIVQARQLLKTGTPLAHQMLNEKLIGMFDPARTSSQLLSGNKNFGDLTERIVGKIGKFFTGTYTEEQQKEIQDTIDQMQSQVITPAKQRIEDYYKGMAKQVGIPESQLNVPDFYGSKNTSSASYPTASAPNGRKVMFKDGRWQPMQP